MTGLSAKAHERLLYLISPIGLLLIWQILLMLGLGEREAEIRRALVDIRAQGCRLLTIGQYLAPSADHLPVARWVTPDEFGAWAREARELGFAEVFSGPLVRSSYRAEQLAAAALG